MKKEKEERMQKRQNTTAKENKEQIIRQKRELKQKRKA